MEISKIERQKKCAAITNLSAGRSRSLTVGMLAEIELLAIIISFELTFRPRQAFDKIKTLPEGGIT